MKKLFTLLAAVAVMAAYHNNVMGQCSIDPNDSSLGFSPPALPCIEQGALYGQAVQVHVPSSLYYAPLGVTVALDSISVKSISGLPAGITYTANPASGTVLGGGTGCIWFQGTTTAATGNYPLVFHIAVSAFGETIDTTLNAIGLVYTLSVCAAPAPQLCDTFFNAQTFELYDIPNGGYFSGNNLYSPFGVAEGFNPSTPGYEVGGAFFSFAVLTINPEDSDKYITMLVLGQDTNNPGAPSPILGMDSFTFRDLVPYVIDSQVNLFFHQLSTPVTVNDTLFFIAIEMPTIPGDTIALWTSAFGDAGTAYFNWPGAGDSGWYTYSQLTGTPHYLTDLAIGAWSCDYNGPVAQFSAVVPGGLLPSVTGCSVDSVHFADESAGPVSQWSWNFPGGEPATSTAQYPYVAYATPGTYAVTLTVTDTVGLTSASTLNNYVTINGSPSVTIAATATSGSASTGTAVATATGTATPFTYLWSNGATGDSISALAAATYYLTVTDANGCKAVDTTTITVTGINFVSANQTIKVYPNPTASALNIDWSAQAQAQVEIMDMTGKVMRTYTVDGSLLNKFDISSLATGTYVVKITDKLSGEFHSITVSKQ